MKKEDFQENILDLNSISSISLEYLENITDPLLDGLVSAIPMVGLMKGIARTGNAIRERHLLKKTLLFMKQLDNSLNSEDEMLLEEYRKKVLSKDKHTNDELDRVLFILDKTVETEKAKFIANAFYKYVNQKINRKAFLEMITVIDVLMVRDLEVVESLIKGKTEFDYKSQQISCNRLVAAGVINQVGVNEIDFLLKDYELSRLGKGIAWYM